MDEAFKIVKCQTNYNDDEIKEKLEEHNGDYIPVIKEYMNITPENSAVNKYNTRTDQSVNQKIYSNIRTFMDDVIKGYNERKELEKETTENDDKKD